MARATGTASLQKIKKNISSYKKNNVLNSNSSSSIERNLKNQNILKTRQEIVDELRVEYFKEKDNYEDIFATNQIEDIDFSKFENHVFYDSAASKTQYSYLKILNEYPYDGSEYDLKQYLSSLDGYTTFIYKEKIPKNLGYLNFDGNNQVLIHDKTGNILKDYLGEYEEGLFNINKKKFCIDFWLYSQGGLYNEVQIVLQKKFNSNGITIWLDNFRKDEESPVSRQICSCNIIINIDQSYVIGTFTIENNKFNHISVNFISHQNKRKILSYVNSKPQIVEQSGVLSVSEKLDINFLKSAVTIGNGVNHLNDGYIVNKTSGLVGYIDEFKFYTNTKKREEIIKDMIRPDFARRGLKIYYKFNEPAGSYLNNYIVLDHSGHKCHGMITDIEREVYNEQENSSFRIKNENIDTPITYEDIELSPVIFPNYAETLKFQSEIIENAVKYDEQNPNIFYNFFPKYYFVEQSDFSGVNNVYVNKEEVTISKNNKIELLNVEKTANSYLVEILLIWARFFDQIKCYIDHISDILRVSYDDINQNNFGSILMPYVVKQAGFDFKEIFPESFLEKLYSKNLVYEKEFSKSSIRQIQNNLWKRFLINSQDALQSKGTINSIKSVFNSFGLEADLFLNIREYNSQNKINLYENFVEKLVSLRYIDFFENSFLNKDVEYNQGSIYPENRAILESILYDTEDVDTTYFKFYNDFSIETFIKFDQNKVENYEYNQSIIRIDNEYFNNSNIDFLSYPVLNLVFKRENKKSKKGVLTLYINENAGIPNTETSVIEIEDVSLMSGKVHYVLIKKAAIGENNLTSKYQLSVTTLDYLSKAESIRSFTAEFDTNNFDNLKNCALRIGNAANYSNRSNESLNYNTDFQGRLLKLRLWSRLLNKKEINIHKTSIQSTGLENLISKNLNDLKINIDLKERFPNDYTANVVNNTFGLRNNIYRQHDYDINLKLNSKKVKNFIGNFDYITFNQNDIIDYPSNYNRVNVNSLNDENLTKDLNLKTVNPSFETLKDFKYYEDIRLSIDFSTAKFLNEEISKIILVQDFYTKTLGNSSSLYEENYQDLSTLRNIFYERLEKEVNIKSLYHVYKYFDNILEEILYSMIPSKVHYHGFNFVVESNISERNKYMYKMSSSRFGVLNAGNLLNEVENYVTENYSDIVEDKALGRRFTNRSLFDERTNTNSINRKNWQ